MKCKVSLLAVLALAACGGSVDGQATNPDLVANAPTFDKFAISQNDSDAVTPSAAPSGSRSQALVADATPAADCHPHLFARTGEIIHDVNRHFYKLLAHVEELIKDSPKLSSGQTRTWESIKDGIDRKLTISASANADGSVTYSFELDVAVQAATPGFVKVMWGSLTHSGPQSVKVADATPERIENKGTVTFDYSALATVVPTEKSSGQIADAFDDVRDPAHGVKNSATLTLTNFHFDDDLHGPRNGSYSWEREPGVGGKFQFTDSLMLLCPASSGGQPADLTAVARWYKADDGSVHARSDAMATGGQIPAGFKWEGLTCAESPSSAGAPAEGEWMIKEENAGGQTVEGQFMQTGLAPCDPAFGPVPSVGDNSHDYDFSQPLSFPKEWQ